MILRRLACSIAASSLAVVAATAQAAETTPAACMSGTELRDLMLSFAPATFGGVRARCAAALPPNSPLQENSAMMLRYKAAAQAAWPRGKAALLTLAPHGRDADTQKVADALTPDAIGALVIPQLIKAIDPGDCRDIDRIATLLEPLPSDNLGELVVWIVRFGQRKKHTDMVGPIRLCPE
jgi:hypothetical protein